MKKLNFRLNHPSPLLVHTANVRGMSLVELLTVLSVIALLAFFVAPDVINWRGNMRLSSAARDLLANMNSARVSAVQENANVVVAIDTANNQYRIFVDDGEGMGIAGNGICDGTEKILTSLSDCSEVDNMVQLNVDGSVDYRGAFLDNSSLGGTIGFTPKGTPIGGNAGTILLRNAGAPPTRWFKIVLNTAGSLSMLKSTDSTNGTDGHWN